MRVLTSDVEVHECTGVQMAKLIVVYRDFNYDIREGELETIKEMFFNVRKIQTVIDNIVLVAVVVEEE